MQSPPSREDHFVSHDGTRLFYRAWGCDGPVSKAVVLLHRGHEHSGRWESFVASLGFEDLPVFAWDARGHGRSPGDRGAAENLGVMIRDVEAFMRHLERAHGVEMENTVVVAHSVGAVIAAAWVHDFAPRLRGLVLATPAFRVKLYVPFAVPMLRLRQRWFGPGQVRSYVKSKMLTHDPAEAKAFRDDPMIFREIAVNILLDLFDTSTRLLADASAIRVPTLMLAAGSDWVVKVSAQRKFFNRLGSQKKEWVLLPGFGHAVFHERDRHLVVAAVRDFISKSLAAPPPPPREEAAGRRTAFERLKSAPESLTAGLMRLSMGTVGRLSNGISLGWRTGFDSGQTLDYVYENRPRGHTPLGRMLDATYLNSPGWRAIRVRREHLEAILRECMQSLASNGRPVHIVDIACGAGRYVIESMRREPDVPATARLRDYKPANVAAANELANATGLADRVVADEGDAFDRDGLARLSPRPTIAIVSGLFELFPENNGVRESLAGLAAAVEPGGFLIYTNQPWHPQLKFIAGVLLNREGQPWIMRCRPQSEMDDLVREAGFEKIRQEIDQWGIFSVSLARRLPA
jgi:alpha-beta hydrolase superfamily lysophospholipase